MNTYIEFILFASAYIFAPAIISILPWYNQLFQTQVQVSFIS